MNKIAEGIINRKVAAWDADNARYHIQTTAKGELAKRISTLRAKNITVIAILTAGCEALERVK